MTARWQLVLALLAVAVAAADWQAAPPVFAVRPMPEDAPALAGSAVWDAPVGNRHQLSGPIFYVRHQAGRPCVVTLRFTAIGTARWARGQLTDGQPANLVLRIFGPDDRSLMAGTIGQPEEGRYELSVDLSAEPPGRYRFALTGWFDDATLAVAPARPIGVIGGPNLGLFAPTTRYLLVPGDVQAWSLALAATKPGQKLTVFDPAGEPAAVIEARVSPRPSAARYATAELPGRAGVWRLEFTGDDRAMLAVDGVPGILWPDAEAAAIADFAVVGGRRIDHAWQRPLAEYLAGLDAQDLALPDLKLPRPDFAALPDDTLFALGQLQGWENGMATAIGLLRDNQIADPDDPAVGLFADVPRPPEPLPLNPDGDNAFGQVHFVRGLAGLYVSPLAGFNPWHRQPALLTRATAGLCQVMLMIPERQHVNLNFVHRKFLAQTAHLLLPHLEPELAEAVRAGLIEEYSRDAYFDGYQSNQGLNVIVGLEYAVAATGDPVLAAWYERYLRAFLADQFVDVNHGQTPAGIYQESGGLDGGYNSYSAQLMIHLWRRTGDPCIRASIARNMELLRHLAVTLPDGRLVSARCWNTRTDSNAYRWHTWRAGADIPAVATFLRRAQDHYLYTTDRDRIATQLARTWGHRRPPALDGSKHWADGGLAARDAVPYAEPLPLACEEAGPWTRSFGDTYLVMRRGPWQAVFFSGDRWCVGQPGSGLATLWHRDLGPLILADGKASHHRDYEPPDYPLTVADGWQSAGKAFCTERWHGAVAADADRVTVSLAPLRGPETFARAYTLTAAGLTASLPADWQPESPVLFLPLVTGPEVALSALDPDGEPMGVDDLQAAPIIGYRWQRGAHHAELRFERPVLATALGPESCAPCTLLIVRHDFGDRPVAWRVE